jgi:signal transduction histidine kinase
MRQAATVTGGWRWAAATSAAAVALLLAAAGCAFAIANHGLPVDDYIVDSPKWHASQNAFSAALFAIPGWYLATRRPGLPFGWLLLAGGVGHGLAAAGWGYLIASEIGGHDFPQPWLGLWFSTWGPALEVPLLAAAVVLFPFGERPRGVLGAIGTACVAITVLGVVTSWIEPVDDLAVDPASEIGQISNPMAVEFFSRFDQEGVLWFAPAMLLLLVVLVVRWLTAKGEARQLLGWLSASQLAGIVFAPLSFLGGEWFMLSVQLPTALGIVILGAAALRHRFFGIELFVQRTFVYSTLLVLVAAVYGAIVGGVTLAAGDAGGGTTFTAVVIAAFVLAPARSRIERVINRLLFGARDEPYSVLSKVGARLESAGSEQELLPEFAAAVRAALRVPYVAVEISEGEETKRFPAGQPQPEVEAFALVQHGRRIGAFQVGLRPGEREFAPRERLLLEDLARQASGAAARLALTEDLIRSRERIVTAREEERRRLRRDLHDGLGPVLTGAAMLIDAARNTVTSDERAADQQLAEARSQVRGAIEDVRRLVYQLRPPALDELGLLGAVREQARRLTVAVDIEADEPFPELPAAVEVAAYRIILEAVTNATRHGRASRCRVQLHLNGHLEIEVVDDGVTSERGWRPGIGIFSMRERAQELGGSCEAGPDDRGHGRVFAAIPVGQP